jgi:hypothetical protein
LFAAALTTSALAGSSHAAFVLVEDFESVADWTNADVIGSVAASSAPAGSVGAVGLWDPTGSEKERRDLGGNSIADGSSGTLFIRTLWTDTTDKDVTFGFSVDDNPDFSDFNGYAEIDGTASPVDLLVRNGGGFTDSADLVQNTWYNLWFVFDNGDTSNSETETYDVYLTTGTASATAADRIADDFAYRGGAGGAIDTFTLREGNSGGRGDAYFDELWIDTTGVNLNNPIPEPASVALLAAGGLLMTGRRR